MSEHNKDKEIIPLNIQGIISVSDSIAQRGRQIIPLLKKDIIFIPRDYSTIDEAIRNANDGATIYIRGGEYKTSASIEKSIKIIGLDDKPKLSIAESKKPAFRITESADNVEIENLDFIGVGDVYCQPSIICYNHNLVIKGCAFQDYELDFDLWEESGDDEYRITSAIYLSGNFQRVTIEGCVFNNCEQSICSDDSNTIEITANRFYKTQLSMYKDVKVKSRDNTLILTGWNLGKNTNLISIRDTYIDCDTLVSSSSASYSEFFHCTVLSKYLFGIGIGVGENLINPTSREIWANGRPQLVFVNCIVHSDFGANICVRYAASSFNLNYDGNKIPQDIFSESLVDFSEHNLLHIPPKYLCEIHGVVIKNQTVVLQQNSPAISRASDGTNLGSYQGQGE